MDRREDEQKRFRTDGDAPVPMVVDVSDEFEEVEEEEDDDVDDMFALLDADKPKKVVKKKVAVSAGSMFADYFVLTFVSRSGSLHLRSYKQHWIRPLTQKATTQLSLGSISTAASIRSSPSWGRACSPSSFVHESCKAILMK
jgi:hypothetical protein